jgi:hypothetical protein
MTHSTLIDALGEHSPDPVGRNARRALLHGAYHRGHGDVSPVRCQSDLGAYYLSRSLLDVKLEQVGPKTSLDYAPPASGLYRLTVKANVIADHAKGYCLDYLASPTSNDELHITRTEDALLTDVRSLADDQSVKIAKKIIDIIFIGITGNPDYRSALDARLADADFVVTTVFEGTYDPTVPMQAALLNERLKDFGHCLILGEHPPESKVDFARYCADPVGYLKHRRIDRSAFHEDRPKAKAAQEIRGIYYRPRRPYSYYILTLEDRKIAGSWKLQRTATARLENDSPILVVGVDRTLFAKRRTRLTFDKGVLQHVAVDKTSELLAFVDVPLYFAEGLVALPGAIIRVDIDTAQAETNLIGAELQLMQQREATRNVEKQIRDKQEEELAKGGGG